MHCVLFVIKAANIDRDADDRTLKRVHEYLADNSKSTIVAGKRHIPVTPVYHFYALVIIFKFVPALIKRKLFKVFFYQP